MPKYYKVNVKKCKPEDVGPIHSIGEFVIMDGQYYETYDVVEELLPPDICNAHRYETRWAKENIDYWAGTASDDEIDYLPLGFSYIPPGAVITEIEL